MYRDLYLGTIPNALATTPRLIVISVFGHLVGIVVYIVVSMLTGPFKCVVVEPVAIEAILVETALLNVREFANVRLERS